MQLNFICSMICFCTILYGAWMFCVVSRAYTSQVDFFRVTQNHPNFFSTNRKACYIENYMIYPSHTCLFFKQYRYINEFFNQIKLHTRPSHYQEERAWIVPLFYHLNNYSIWKSHSLTVNSRACDGNNLF
jgi:hypothetical protein